MAIKYCSWTSGNDSTGDGTASNPYKTITKASQSLTGGDEVRVAKSPAPINLTPTFSFTNGSTTVTASSSVFVNAVSGGESDGSVRLGDFIKGGDGNWWEIVDVLSGTEAELYQRYSGSTQAGIGSQKLMTTSTGAAANSTAIVQEVKSSGSSFSTLKISGGWNLSGTPTQDGQTFFRQLHETFDCRWGYGLYLSYRTYVETSRLHFLRYNYGIFLKFAQNNTITSPTCNSNDNYGIQLENSSNNTITSPTCNSNGNEGFYFLFSPNNTITSPTYNSNSSSGIRFERGSSNNTIIYPTCNSNISNGIIFEFSSNNIIISPTCNNNGNAGICSNHSSNNIVINYSGTDNENWEIYVVEDSDYSEYPCLLMQHFKVVGDNRCYYEYGVTYRDTSNPRGGNGECLKFSPTSDTYYISQSFYFVAEDGVSKTISAYIMKDEDFDGDVQGAIYFMGNNISNWMDITPSSDNTYEQKSLVANAIYITEDGVLELRIKARGTAGNIYVDDLSIE